MSGIVVDTSVWIDYFAGSNIPIVDQALQDGFVVMPMVVAAELLSGVHTTVQAAELRDFLSQLSHHGEDFNHWCRVGALRAKLRKKGFHVSTPDAHIAQCCLDLNAPLVTRDAIFSKMAKHIALAVV